MFFFLSSLPCAQAEALIFFSHSMAHYMLHGIVLVLVGGGIYTQHTHVATTSTAQQPNSPTAHQPEHSESNVCLTPILRAFDSFYYLFFSYFYLRSNFLFLADAAVSFALCLVLQCDVRDVCVCVRSYVRSIQTVFYR